MGIPKLIQYSHGRKWPDCWMVWYNTTWISDYLMQSIYHLNTGLSFCPVSRMAILVQPFERGNNCSYDPNHSHTKISKLRTSKCSDFERVLNLDVWYSSPTVVIFPWLFQNANVKGKADKNMESTDRDYFLTENSKCQSNITSKMAFKVVSE